MIDLDAMKARLAAATPGPWTSHEPGWCAEHPAGPMEIERLAYSIVSLASSTPTERTAFATDRASAQLIAHAPADIAALVAEVERLRTELAARPAITLSDARLYVAYQRDIYPMNAPERQARERIEAALVAFADGGSNG